ncbi:poly-beta-1,6-N-acetyl-D-glucosamine N-deacetylase PgaB [Bdellovibrio sp. SKB1291214]|uniref:poly-beta-1,6-N-acetyl-D-glucosamine N-deacetylase PgaB n=1 Tax=Bdellovibrio sp. SKB1291214 TaxID=1732569 RepID=UPI00223F69C9|nr:poly-beta-1,6-N-acetyl-D-glucosamine N-deacetylase PgaB [Bdellovibrio sp. SKB1291214]UYL08037.1 poly-beta-1,6-N-acetyl-D-glucosamine N-deacetylase PgaB [Bdellovibrio sp. SKB1291214]
MNSVGGVNILKLVLLLAFSLTSHAQNLTAPEITGAPANSFVALCYHDVSNGFVGNEFSIRRKDLVDQFDYLKAHYNVVSLQDIIDANQGKKNLPPKAVLITVDDGLGSFYEIVYPLLKEYKFPAVFAVVTKWTEDGAAPDYGFKDSNPKMASWKHLKEMMKSGLVDVVSHTHDLHQGHIFNPQGNQAAVAGFFKYDPVTKTYQTEEEMSSRVEFDLRKSNEQLKKHLGKDNTVIVWPYGQTNGVSKKAAEKAGMKIQMTLRPGFNNASDISEIGRGLVMAAMDIPQFATAVEKAFVDQNPVRMVRVDLDSIWKNNEAETEQGLGDLLEHGLDLSPSAVLVQAVSDSGEAYFVTDKMKMRGDYLNRASHTLKNRARVAWSYGRLPQSFLKNTDTAKAALRDLAKFTDIDGLFFEVSAKDNLSEIPFESLMATVRSIRPAMKFGLIGQQPTNSTLFDYVILNTKQLDKAKTTQPESISLSKEIIALPKDYKSDASHLLAQGYLNLFYDVNFKGFQPDADFKSLFTIRPIFPPHKGEAK